MTRIIKKAVWSVLCVFALASAFSGAAAANASSAVLPAGFLIGDQNGVYVNPHGYYYIDVREIRAGDVIRKTLTIENMAQNDMAMEGNVPYTLTMTAEPLFSRGPADLLDTTHLTLKLDGAVIYDGPCRGDGNPNMIQNALHLGQYKVGERRILDITLTADPNLRISEEKSEADFRWLFYAYRTVETQPPKTGVLETYGLYLIPICWLLTLGTFLIMKKRRKTDEPNTGCAPRT